MVNNTDEEFEGNITGPVEGVVTEPGYKKDLGTWHVVLFAIGAILGPAVAYAAVYTIAFAGPVGILSWLVAMAMLIPVGLVFSELGTMWPKAGGVAYYPSKSNGPLVGAINGWSSYVGYLLVGPVIVFALVEYLGYYFPSFYNFSTGLLTVEGIVVAEVLLVLVFLINMLRIRHMGNINMILTFITVGLIAVLLIGLSFSFNPGNLSNKVYGGIAPYGAAGFFTAITFTVFGYGGFRQPVDYAEEAKNPGRSIPLAIIISLLVSGAIYTLLAFVFVGSATPELFRSIGANPGNWAAFYGSVSPYASEAKALALPLIVVVAVVVAVIATFKDGVIYYGGTARVGQVIAKEDNFFPRMFGKLSHKGVPVLSVILVLIITIVLVALGRSLSTVIGYMVDAFLLSYAPGCISLVVFRRTDPEVKRPFKLPLANIVAPIAWVVTTLMVYWSGFTVIKLIVPLDLAGILLLVFYARSHKVSVKSLGYGIWMPLFFLFILGYSYIGSSFFGGLNFIPFPWDSVVFIVVSVLFYFAAVEMGVKSRRQEMERTKLSSKA